MELTELESTRLERAVTLSRSRIERAHRELLSVGNGIYRATSESFADRPEIDPDGNTISYFRAGMIVGSAALKATR